MNLSLKQHKENENKMHELLYNNILLLTGFYPTNKEFDAQFRKDMFVKNNKSAFYEVVYYLLTVLNPELTKKNITMWPPYEIKRENKFRSEVLKFINQLNSLYDSSDIPVLMASHLISPGGYKFVKFMLKLSQLVVFEHLKKHESSMDLLFPIKANKNVELNKTVVANLKRKTALIENETATILNEYEDFFSISNQNACKIVDEQSVLNAEIRDLNEKCQSVKEQYNQKNKLYPSVENLQKSLVILKEKSKFSHKIHQLLTESEQLILYLSGNDLVLTHNQAKLSIPDEISHLVKNGEHLDLLEFFHGLQVLLGRKFLELPNPSDTFLKNLTDKIMQLNKRLKELENNLLEKQVDLIKAMEYEKLKFYTPSSTIIN